MGKALHKSRFCKWITSFRRNTSCTRLHGEKQPVTATQRMRFCRRRQKSGKDGKMRRVSKISRSMSFLPFSSMAVQYRRSSGRFFLFADIIPQGVKAKHQYIMSTHHLIHIQLRMTGLFASRQFIYLHGYISFLCFLFVEYK